ncbi:hypothetical protein [Methylobacterium sp. WL30]|uniref:hypothetical protein n=1 Tax=Methylobacterium sp. WL30 TaxID=2603895 RepID=UPI001FEF7853|nr:hypothetical protein [Methylobacterium sp. WL30]
MKSGILADTAGVCIAGPLSGEHANGSPAVKPLLASVAQTKEQAKQAADATARVGSQGALYGALALVLGALSAFFAGRGAAVDPVLTRTAPVVTTQRRV